MADIQKVVDEFNRHIASRQPLDIREVYARFAPRFPGVFRLEEGDRKHGEDFQILHGSSCAGRFEVYDNGLDIVFDVYKPDGSYTHWHPADLDEVIEDIQEFLHGRSKY